jgi:deoxyribose-phosphate aldolase
MDVDIARIIDHTILKPEASEDAVKRICEEALKYKFASVCINPTNVELAAELLKNSEVRVCTVIGFPLGANTTEVKAFETEDAIKKGAQEVDMVINIGKLKSGQYDYVKNDIKAVVKAAKGKALTKVIIETCLLNNEEKKLVCKMAKEVGADFVKTSTGFSSGGATSEDVKLMRDTVGMDMGVKASGGIRNRKDAENVIKAGASRIGASASVAICTNQEGKTDY